ncbi:hypothetical protein H7H73_10785, partial [Mycobacterium rufum]|nr:hypothetical protein [Mycolicibacterium rufum]
PTVRKALPSAAVAAVGGGGAPDVELPSAAISLPEHYAAALRTGARAVVGRIEDGRCLLDLRTVAPGDDAALLEAVRACASLSAEPTCTS